MCTTSGTDTEETAPVRASLSASMAITSKLITPCTIPSNVAAAPVARIATPSAPPQGQRRRGVSNVSSSNAACAAEAATKVGG